MTTKTNKTNETKMKIGEADRMKGMLWGLVVGDCLGSPIQFTSKDGHPWIEEMEECPVFRLPPGYWTDDSSMAMCVMDSYIRKEGYDLKDIGATFCKWLKTGYLSSKDGQAFDVGGATWSSCVRIARGSLVNGTEDSQGNGSIMRFAPSYLIARKLGRAEVMHEVSDLTHASKRVREVVDRFAGVLDEHMSGKRTSAKSAYNTREEVNNSGWAVSTLEAALWAFETTDSFEDGMIAAVNLGGDSDSIGAVYGQVAGGFYGFDAIPDRWVKAVKDWRKVDAMIDEFVELVEAEELKDCETKETPKIDFKPDTPRQHIAIFHKKVKEPCGAIVAPKVGVPLADIRTIAESHVDGTTLVRTTDGGTIAVSETFEEAMTIWGNC